MATPRRIVGSSCSSPLPKHNGSKDEYGPFGQGRRREVDMSVGCKAENSTVTLLPPEAIAGIVIAVIIIIIVAAAAGFIIVLIIFVYWKKKQGKSPIAEQMTAPSNHEEMQDRKELNKKEELTYVVADFSKAPPAESNKPKKEEPVQYTGVQFAHS